jgi:hypothetical protein
MNSAERHPGWAAPACMARGLSGDSLDQTPSGLVYRADYGFAPGVERPPTDTQGDLPERVSAPEDVVWQNVHGIVLLLDVNSGRYHRFDDVATRMWEALDESPDVATAVDRLAALYDVDMATLRRDLAALIAQLVDTGLLRVDA